MTSSWIERRHLRAARSRTPSVDYTPLRDDALSHKYGDLVNRSFSPARELVRSASMNYLGESGSQGLNKARYRFNYPYDSPFGQSSRRNRYVEDQPLRKYDVFALRTWTYPIWKYLNRPESSSRPYYLADNYTPPLMTGDYARHNPYKKDGYSGYSYLAGEHSFQLADVTYRGTYKHWHQPIKTVSPWTTTYYGQQSLRHFGGYRKRNFISSRSRWMSY